MEAKTTQLTTINERVMQLVEALKIKPSNFAESIGKTPTAIYTIVNGRNKPGYDILEAIIRQYPQINPDWLFLGQGEIFRLAQRPADGGAFGELVLNGLDDIRHVFQEELKAKNHQLEAKDQQILAKDNQIDRLTRMLENAMGKHEDTPTTGRVIPLWQNEEKAAV